MRSWRMSIASFLVLILLAGTFSLPGEAKAASSDAQKIISLGKKYMGVPYVYGGTTPSGFDCSGFVRYIYKKNGIGLPRVTSDMYRTGKAVSKSQLDEGDLVFFNTSGRGVSHVGVYVGNSSFLHASTSHGVMVSSINDPYYWKSRYVGAKRVLDSKEYIFKDVSEEFWGYKDIQYLSNRNILDADKNKAFRPNSRIQREDVAVLVSKALNLKGTASGGTQFKDVSESNNAYAAIQAVSGAGIIRGDENQNFRPAESLSREHLALILVRAFNLPPAKNAVAFKDVPKDYYAYDAIQRLAAAGITTGKGDGTFAPGERVTNAQFSAFLSRSLKK